MNPETDVLDRVNLTAEVIAAWAKIAQEAAKRMPLGSRLAGIPEECAKPVENGALLIWIDLPHERVELLVAAGHWVWSDRARNS